MMRTACQSQSAASDCGSSDYNRSVTTAKAAGSLRKRASASDSVCSTSLLATTALGDRLGPCSQGLSRFAAKALSLSVRSSLLLSAALLSAAALVLLVRPSPVEWIAWQWRPASAARRLNLKEIPPGLNLTALMVGRDEEQQELSRANQVYLTNKRKQAQHLRDSGALRSPASELSEQTKWLTVLAPAFPCPRPYRVGNYGGGGKWLCLMRSLFRTWPPVVVSIGPKTPSDFEREMEGLLGATVLLHQPLSPAQVSATSRGLNFSQSLRGPVPGTAERQISPPSKQLVSFLDLVASSGRHFFDVVRVDCGGCEAALADELKRAYGAGRNPPIGQLLVSSSEIDNAKLEEFFYPLERMGFRLFQYEQNGKNASDKCRFSFIHESLINNDA